MGTGKTWHYWLRMPTLTTPNLRLLTSRATTPSTSVGHTTWSLVFYSTLDRLSRVIKGVMVMSLITQL